MQLKAHILAELHDVASRLQQLEREAAGVRATPAHMPTAELPRTLAQIADHHLSLCYEFAKFALRESINGEAGVDALLEVPDSLEPLTQRRQRIATAVRQQVAAWIGAGPWPSTHDAPKYARTIINEELSR